MASNISLVPSAKDLLMVFPRLAQRAGYAVFQFPEQVDSVLNKIRSGGSVIADATAANMTGPAITQSSSAFVQSTQMADAAAESVERGMFSWFTDSFKFESMRGFGGMFSYFSSRWALATFAVSILLNRTHFYASSRQNLTIPWHTRLFLYSVPMLLMAVQTLWVLQAMRCQTSPDYPLLRYGDPDKNLAINFGGDGGFMYRLSSSILSWQSDSDSCTAMDMSPKDNNKLNVVGSFSFMWPFFVTLCISQFVETLACALQGRQPMPETGMTTFEHSLAFAECEAMISNALGLGLFSPSSKPDRSADSGSSTPSPDAVLLTKSMILRRLNAPSEVLLICFISCLSHLSSAALAIMGQRQRFRLVNTGIWALCYMSALLWSFARVMNNPLGGENDLGILRFPTVCIIGFIPHLLILCGITICACIYGLALLVTALSLPPGSPQNPSVSERFSLAYHNLQANIHFTSSTSIKINWQEDFYTMLLKLGFGMLTAASEAVYLNEGSAVRIHDLTWLEEKRVQELAADSAQRRHKNYIPAELLGERIAAGIQFSDSSSSDTQSGFARERKSTTSKQSDASGVGGMDSGLGLTERRSRWHLMRQFFRGIADLIARINAHIILRLLEKTGINRRPAWLLRYSRSSSTKPVTIAKTKSRGQGRNFWMKSADGSFTAVEDDNVDVEAEISRRLRAQMGGTTEDMVDAKLYNWWKTGGWWGEVDSSGDFQSSEHDDDDTTSMLSMSTNADGFESEAESDHGRRTPTQEQPFPSQQIDPDRTFGVSDLARLLDPQNAEDREEARMLSRHLQSDRPMTRSQYRRRLNHDRARILPLARRSLTDGVSHVGAASAMEEEEALEQFLIERRAVARAKASNSSSWASGAEGMGAGGPQCVVCQSSPRVVLVWPCGCLSICDDCRVGVAARNFSNCLCCRTSVVAYSRLYVP